MRGRETVVMSATLAGMGNISSFMSAIIGAGEQQCASHIVWRAATHCVAHTSRGLWRTTTHCDGLLVVCGEAHDIHGFGSTCKKCKHISVFWPLIIISAGLGTDKLGGAGYSEGGGLRVILQLLFTTLPEITSSHRPSVQKGRNSSQYRGKEQPTTNYLFLPIRSIGGRNNLSLALVLPIRSIGGRNNLSLALVLPIRGIGGTLLLEQHCHWSRIPGDRDFFAQRTLQMENMRALVVLWGIGVGFGDRRCRVLYCEHRVMLFTVWRRFTAESYLRSC